MADIAGIGLSGLLANRSALTTISHNIVNVDTQGYTRQRTELDTRLPIRYGGAFLGQGVDANTVVRLSNQFVTDQMRRDTQNFHAFDAYQEYAVRLDSLLGDDATAITPTLQKFFDSIQQLSVDPTSIATRQVLLSQGQALVNRFNTVYEQVFQQNQALDMEMNTVAAEITQRASDVAKLNNSIRAFKGNNIGQMPNDLLDQRDEAIRKLSELIDVQVVPDNELSVNVFVGNGQPLVIGGDSFQLSTQQASSGIQSSNIALTFGASKFDITSNVSGGRLGGLLSVREQLIDPIFNEMGRMALVLADTFNQQHQLGMDLNSNLGGMFFSGFNDPAQEATRVSATTGNTGSAAFTVTIDDTSALKAVDYRLEFDGTNYRLYNAANNTQVGAPFAPPVAGTPVPFATEGFTLNIGSGAPAAGDSWLVTPTRFATKDMGLQINRVDQIAAALPVRTTLPSTNVGSGFVEKVVVTDTTTASFTTPPAQTLTPAYTVVFTSPTAYQVTLTGSGPPATVVGAGTFTPNQSNNLLQLAGITGSGYEIVFNGSPAVGDQININYNTGGVGDNRNALLLSELRTAKTVANGTASLQSSYGQLVSGVGTRTRDAKVGQEASESILRQIEAQRESISGVNLDEEAADLMRFQQAYQSSAKIIQVSSQLFDTILSSL